MVDGEKIRVQKWLSQMGVSSRRTAEEWIREGRVKINGKKAELGASIDPNRDHVQVDGREIKRSSKPPQVYWLLNKPDQTLTSTKSQGGKPTIFELPKLSNISFLVSPVGRLDFRSEGLLLLSNDGEFVHRLSHPSYKLPRTYQVLSGRRLTREEEAEIERGMQLDDGPLKGAKIRYVQKQKLGATRGYWYFVTVNEGRNRLVRRMFESFDAKVIRLIRIGFGDLKLPHDLAPGEYRQLSSWELKQLKQAAKLI